MKEICFERFGPPSMVAQCIDVPDIGEPSAWEVVLDIEAFPINPADLAMLSGQYGTLPKLPSTIGMEAAGRVVQCGSSVKNFAIDDRVMIMANNNWTQRCKIPAAALCKVPRSLDPLQAAMMKVNPATAYWMLTRQINMEPSEWVIQNAPLSNVGRCVIQLARALGYRTINLVRRPDAIEQVLKVGGDVALEIGTGLREKIKSIVGRRSVRLALDAVGGDATQKLADLLYDGGTIVHYGMLSGQPCVLSSEQLIFHGISLHGFWLSKVINRMSLKDRTELFGFLSDLMDRGELRCEVDSCFGIEEIGDALRRAEQRERVGTVMVLPNGKIAAYE